MYVFANVQFNFNVTTMYFIVVFGIVKGNLKGLTFYSRAKHPFWNDCGSDLWNNHHTNKKVQKLPSYYIKFNYTYTYVHYIETANLTIGFGSWTKLNLTFSFKQIRVCIRMVCASSMYYEGKFDGYKLISQQAE